MQAGMGITDGIIQGKISCFRNKFHKHKEKCSEKRKFLGALCLRSVRAAKAALRIYGLFFRLLFGTCFLQRLRKPDINPFDSVFFHPVNTEKNIIIC